MRLYWLRSFTNWFRSRTGYASVNNNRQEQYWYHNNISILTHSYVYLCLVWMYSSACRSIEGIAVRTTFIYIGKMGLFMCAMITLESDNTHPSWLPITFYCQIITRALNWVHLVRKEKIGWQQMVTQNIIIVEVRRQSKKTKFKDAVNNLIKSKQNIIRA